MNKKAVAINILVGVIAAAIALFVLFGVGKPLYAAMKDAPLASQCQFSVMLSSLGETLSFGTTRLPAECKMKRLTLKQEDLEPYMRLAKKRLDFYYKNNHPALAYFSPDSQRDLYRWSLQKIIADEMVSCHNRGWRGRLPLKSNIPGISDLSQGEFVCILCTRIRFDDSLKQIFGADTEQWMKFWLDANNREGMTYKQLLKDGIDPDMQYHVDFAMYDLDKPVAVVFVAGTGKRSGEFTKYALGSTALYDYDTLTTDLGFTMRSSIFGITLDTERAKCKLIIGD